MDVDDGWIEIFRILFFILFFVRYPMIHVNFLFVTQMTLFLILSQSKTKQ